MNRSWLTIQQAREYSKIGRNKLYALIESGEIYAKKVGRRLIVSRWSIDEYLDSDRTNITVAVDEYIRKM